MSNARTGVTSAAWSPDGGRFAVANHQRIWLFDAAGLEPERTLYAGRKVDIGYRYLKRHGLDNTLVFLSDGLVATTGMGAMVTVWDAQTGARVDAFDWAAEIGLPTSLAYDRASDTLAIGTVSGTVMLVRRGTGEAPLKLMGHEDPVLALEFGRNARYLGAAGAGPAMIVWDVGTQQEVARIPVDDVVRDLGRLDRGFLVAGKELQIWNFRTGEEGAAPGNPDQAGDVVAFVGVAAAEVGFALAVSTIPYYGAGLASGMAGMVFLPAAVIPNTWVAWCKRSVAATADGRLVADMHPGWVTEKIRVLETATGKVLHEIDPRGADTCSLAFSPDGRRLLIANQKGGHVYDLESRKTTRLDMRYAKPR